MQTIKPTPSQAAFVLKNFMKETGVEIQLGKAQEAIARLYGYTNWNSLTSVMDPKVGEPKPEEGCLLQKRPHEYQLMLSKQSSVWLQVNNIDVYVECGERGVDVLLYPHGDAPNMEEALDSAQATFSDAKEAVARAADDRGDPEGNNASDKREDDLFVLLLTADRVQTSNTAGPVRIESKNLKGLQGVINGDDPDDFDFAEAALTYRDYSGVVQNISLGALIEASYLGETGWVLPSGTELWVYQPKNASSGVTSTEVTKPNLCNELLTGDRVQLADTDGPVAFDKNEAVLRDAVNEKLFKQDIGTWGIRYVDFDGNVQTIGMASLLGAYRRNEAWDLPSGAELWVHQPAADSETMSHKAEKEPALILVEKMLAATKAKRAPAGKHERVMYKNEALLQETLASGLQALRDVHRNRAVFEFSNGNDGWSTITASDILNAQVSGTNGWSLPGDRMLWVW